MRPFARHYDNLYSDKDYEQDIRVLKALSHPCRLESARILEIGAGTGNHTVRLAEGAGKVVSLEIDPDFANIAKAKISAFSNATVLETSIEALPENDFDGSAAFFNVLNYVPADKMKLFASSLAARLKPGGWFVTDLWNADAVLADPPRAERRRKLSNAICVTQNIRPEINVRSQMVALHYDIEVDGPAGPENFSETLIMHLHRLAELTVTLVDVGFSNIEFYDRKAFPASATGASWQVWMRAKKL